MKTSIATVSISGDLREKLDAIAGAGFHGVEIFENDFLIYDASPREVGRMVRDAGLALTLFQPFRDFEGMPEPFRQRAFDRAERKFDIMGELGADLMLICSSTSQVALGGIDRIANDFAELGERAAKRGLRVGYEALAWGRHVSDHRDAWEVVRRADHANIGLVLDSFHTLSRRIDVNSIRAIPADKIFIVQLADAPDFDMDLLYWSRHFRNMPGEGDLPVVDFMRAVSATGYDGVISLEIFNDQFRAADSRAVAVDGQRSLLNLMDQVQRAEPQLAINLPAIAPPVEVERVEFVEFTADRHAAEPLVAMLGAMGFRHTGQHRSKDVARYEQGGISVVVNSDSRGLAHRTFQTRGLSAYAFGVRVPDAAAALDRAVALGAKPFTQNLKSDDLNLPAVKGVGGGLVYFFDDSEALAKVWDTEFVALGSPEPIADAGLGRFDHIAQSMPYDEMLRWLLFYSSTLKVEKTPLVDIIDPSGLVRSQVVQNDDRSLRITMNGAENPATVAGQFLAETLGAGIQHLAFASDDIFATAEILQSRGFVPLQISPNYYEDLEARFGLDPDFVARLKRHQIMYDEDAGGRYLQLYSPILSGGFFFEIVERQGYDGYGAANAIFRIAAQRRLVGSRAMQSGRAAT
ncbi:4-hydroxyphenylpyruvate dioxygenase [Devosia lucknowensis]|uniref:3-dehydroshikimate dehydratase n=1 Tax=Devosia lucknowensis TaxID=1096929 RepID=A0A1Y6G9R8_9HYPH|nr:sugar phosphate isomerase/epimerase and 4-hydroxyphenylpyruvate domain-containing protein [Devosia lucknowensis]SMQ85448.1 4-hydroxyphenylpyruvate dioxygenase [Devosia lucknowensis]